MTAQIPLHYPLRTDYAAENFTLGPANSLAWRMVMEEPWGGVHGLYLWGEEGSGKSHLAALWLQKGEGEVIEDIERFSGQEEALFFALNRAKDAGQKLLVTARVSPQEVRFQRPDITSRLKGFQEAQIEAPDDALLKSLLLKQAADRQLKLQPEVVEYLLPRMQRSYKAVSEIIRQLDEASLASRREITVPLAREIISR